MSFIRRIALCLLVSVCGGISPVPAGAAPVPFPDMERSWFGYREAVNELKENNVIGGYPDGTFKPKNTINRAELLKIIFQAAGGPEPVSGSCFSDVREDDWFAPFVCAAQRRDIVKGYPDGSFKPDQAVNFAEAIKMILLAYGEDITERPTKQWYEPYASELDRNDVLRRSSYLPWAPLTRERAADLVLRVMEFQHDRTDARLSPGCGKTEREAPTTIAVGGMERSFILDLPSGMSRRDPLPLIVAFHGKTNDNEMVRSYFGLKREATDYIVAYPAALKRDTGTFYWSDPGDKLSTLRDLAFFDAIVETLGDSYCIDMDRIYTVGHSLGAWMANSVACARGGVVRASATVGGDSMIAPCAGPSSMLMIHHQRDNLTSFASAVKAKDQIVAADACEQNTKEVAPSNLQCVEYAGCDGGNTVVFCPHEQDRDRQGNFYPHQWPEGTAKTIVDFFEDLD